jgi:DASS family divalent anion:Na+ symporter
LGRATILWRWAAVLIPGAMLYIAPLTAFTPLQRHLLAVFTATIIALVAQPVPMGVSVLIAMTLLALTRTLSPAAVLAGFSNVVVWLIFTAFLFARAVTATGFGMRVAYVFVRQFGRSPLTLGYSIAAAGVALSPFVPSDTARGGGIIYPITRSLAQAFDSEPGPTARRLGSFLILAAFHANYTASAMFLTSMASNPLIAEFAHKIGHVELTWARWALASSVPGFLALLIVPFVIYRLHRPEIRDTAAARGLAATRLREMGPMSGRELRLAIILMAVMAGWVTSPWHGVSNTFVALTGVCAILILRVLNWDDLLAETKAWDALIWFAPLVMMADELNETGVIKILSASVFGYLHGWPPVVAMFALVGAYLYVHYAFASMTAQVTALYPAFLAAAMVAGSPALPAALLLAFFSNLNAGLTHYGTGSAPVFFNAGYVGQATWWKLGFVISVVNVAIWFGIGSIWWRVVALW